MIARLEEENPNGSWIRKYCEENNPLLKTAQGVNDQLTIEKNSLAKEVADLQRMVADLRSAQENQEYSLRSRGSVQNNNFENNISREPQPQINGTQNLPRINQNDAITLISNANSASSGLDQTQGDANSIILNTINAQS